MKDGIYWLIYNRLKTKHPKWTNKQLRTIAYRVRYKKWIKKEQMK